MGPRYLPCVPPFHLRTATVEDAAALSDFAARAFHETFAADNRPEDMSAYLAETFSPELQAAELEDRPGDVFVAQDEEGAVVGCAQLCRGPAPACLPPGTALELQRLYVDRRWHGTGLGRALMEAVLARARSEGAAQLWLGVWERNERAKAFYGKLGFRQYGEKVFMLGSDAQTDWVMARPV